MCQQQYRVLMHLYMLILESIVRCTEHVSARDVFFIVAVNCWR